MDIDKNSMAYWWPKTKGLNIPQAKTIMVPIGDYMRIVPIFDGEASKAFDSLVKGVDAACRKVGYPAFVRDDQMSAKHGWKDTCHVPDSASLANRLYALLEDHECTMSIPPVPAPRAIFVRELLALESTFTAFYGELPISRERRLFVKDGAVVCDHPYWPPETIRDPSRKDWKGRLAKLNSITKGEGEVLAGRARKICGAVGGGYWSVDFCKASKVPKPWMDGWYFTDMALGICSYHWEGCKKAEQRGGDA